MNKKNLRVGIDLMFIGNPEHVSGIQSHAEDILTGFREIGKLKQCKLYTLSSCRDYFSNKYPEAEIPLIDDHSRIFKKYILKSYQNFSGRSGSNTMQNLEISVYHKRAAEACDVVLHTFHDNLRSNVIKNAKNIWVFHDLFSQTMAEFSKKRKLAANVKYAEYLRRCEAIVTISNFVKNDIYKYYHDIKISNLSVIPNAVLINNNTACFDSKIPNEIPYILNINAIREHKNHITLIKAFQKIMDDIPHLLVIVGAPGDVYNDIERYIKDNEMSDRVKILSFISDQEKASLYSGASLFVTTSLHEGFGRTPIEAAMYRIPVISSRCDSLPEATMEMLDYYEPPCDFNVLALKIMEVLSRKNDTEKLKLTAEKFHSNYSCRSVAERYWELIEEVCSKP
jgi:glycosyltransferase involved in cell wall biosynthesis